MGADGRCGNNMSLSLLRIDYDNLRDIATAILANPTDENFELVEDRVRLYNKYFAGRGHKLDPALFAAWCARIADRRRQK